ncbi:MAG: hypothetical protein ACRD0U_04770 [Acidimicrobiales bacterium]
MGPTRGGQAALVDLERYLAGAGRRRVGLSEMERESVARGREIARRSLQAHIDERANRDVGVAALIVDDPSGAVRLAYKRLHTRRIVTMVGELDVRGWATARPGARASTPSTPTYGCRDGRSATRSSATWPGRRCVGRSTRPST